jgi:hypothetical protein
MDMHKVTHYTEDWLPTLRQSFFLQQSSLQMTCGIVHGEKFWREVHVTYHKILEQVNAFNYNVNVTAIN